MSEFSVLKNSLLLVNVDFISEYGGSKGTAFMYPTSIE